MGEAGLEGEPGAGTGRKSSPQKALDGPKIRLKKGQEGEVGGRVGGGGAMAPTVLVWQPRIQRHGCGADPGDGAAVWRAGF